MALFIKQDGQKSELQKKLQTELQEKLKKQADLDQQLPDGVEDSAYMKDKRETSSLAWLWMVLVVAFIGISLWIITS